MRAISAIVNCHIASVRLWIECLPDVPRIETSIFMKHLIPPFLLAAAGIGIAWHILDPEAPPPQFVEARPQLSSPQNQSQTMNGFVNLWNNSGSVSPAASQPAEHNRNSSGDPQEK